MLLFQKLVNYSRNFRYFFNYIIYNIKNIIGLHEKLIQINLGFFISDC